MDDQLRSAISTALRINEIGRDSPYHLSFAGKGKSGASFGASQGDLAAQPLARDTLWKILAANHVSQATIASILGQLSGPLYSNPLSTEDDRLVEQALASPQGRDLVDAMDKTIMESVCQSVADCEAVAAAAGISLERNAELYMALWINMTGPPTTLKQWVGGSEVWLDSLRNKIAAPSGHVSSSMMISYLKNCDYFIANPQNFPHMQEAVTAAAAYL